jgi:hypothetical protein
LDPSLVKICLGGECPKGNVPIPALVGYGLLSLYLD